MPGDTLFVGIGSDHGDDRVGWIVADELAQRLPANTIVRRAKSPLDLIDWLEGIRCLAICDACRGAGPVGTWRRWTWPNVNVPRIKSAGSHALGLVDTLQLAHQLGMLPDAVFIWGVEILDSESGAVLSNPAKTAIALVGLDIVRTLARHHTTQAGPPDPCRSTDRIVDALPREVGE